MFTLFESKAKKRFKYVFVPFKITVSPLRVTFVGTLFPRTKICAARAAQFYTFTDVFNVWLGPRELDSPVCFCLQSVGARGRVRHRPRAAAGDSGPQHSPGLRRPADPAYRSVGPREWGPSPWASASCRGPNVTDIVHQSILASLRNRILKLKSIFRISCM